jgi:hypothetical protein
MIKQSREYKNKKKIQKATLSHLSLSPKNHGRQAAASARLARACQPAGEGAPRSTRRRSHARPNHAARESRRVIALRCRKQKQQAYRSFRVRAVSPVIDSAKVKRTGTEYSTGRHRIMDGWRRETAPVPRYLVGRWRGWTRRRPAVRRPAPTNPPPTATDL